jgi:hypothetical protein
MAQVTEIDKGEIKQAFIEWKNDPTNKQKAAFLEGLFAQAIRSGFGVRIQIDASLLDDYKMGFDKGLVSQLNKNGKLPLGRQSADEIYYGRKKRNWAILEREPIPDGGGWAMSLWSFGCAVLHDTFNGGAMNGFLMPGDIGQKERTQYDCVGRGAMGWIPVDQVKNIYLVDPQKTSKFWFENSTIE